MKATLLLENNSLFGTRYLAEHGFSLYIEDEQTRILYDTGYSYPFIKKRGEDGYRPDTARLCDHLPRAPRPLRRCQVPHKVRTRRNAVDAPAGRCSSRGRTSSSGRRFINEENRECGFDTDRDVLERYFKLEFEPNVRWLTPQSGLPGEDPPAERL